MLRISSLLISTAFLAAVLLIAPSKGWAAELPEGVTVQTVVEYSVDVSGLEKVVLRKRRRGCGSRDCRARPGFARPRGSGCRVLSREHGSHIDTRFFAYLVVTLFNPTGRGVPSYVAK